MIYILPIYDIITTYIGGYMDDNYFYTYFDGIRVKLPKKLAEFNGGYGVVKFVMQTRSKEIDIQGVIAYNVIGLIDENYNTLFELSEIIEDIEIFNEDNIILKCTCQNQKEINAGLNSQCFHYKIINNKPKLQTIIKFDDYTVFEDGKLLFENNSTGNNLLYDLEYNKSKVKSLNFRPLH